jgi:Asp-tRNA(Asn)/Glu-tRNA(Gln) amidotransferase B subunit
MKMTDQNGNTAIREKNCEECHARAHRFAFVHQMSEAGIMDEEMAKEILAGPLSPDDPDTAVDDSGLLAISSMEEVAYTIMASYGCKGSHGDGANAEGAF